MFQKKISLQKLGHLFPPCKPLFFPFPPHIRSCQLLEQIHHGISRFSRWQRQLLLHCGFRSRRLRLQRRRGVFRRWWCLRCATVMAAAAKAAGADGPRVPGALSTRCGAWEHATEGNTPEGELFSDGATNNMANEDNDFLSRKWRKR